MQLFLFGLILLACVGCSDSHRTSSPAPKTTIASTTTTFNPLRFDHGLRYGAITGRYYAEGGPPPPEPPRPIMGTITVTNVATHEVFRPREDSGGYFRQSVPPGTYEVAARSRDIAEPMTRTVTVPSGETVSADLVIAMI